MIDQWEGRPTHPLNNGTWDIRLSVANILMRRLTHFWSSECVQIMNEKTFFETFLFHVSFGRQNHGRSKSSFIRSKSGRDKIIRSLEDFETQQSWRNKSARTNTQHFQNNKNYLLFVCFLLKMVLTLMQKIDKEKLLWIMSDQKKIVPF